MFIKNLISRFSKIFKALCIISCFIGISGPASAGLFDDLFSRIFPQQESPSTKQESASMEDIVSAIVNSISNQKDLNEEIARAKEAEGKLFAENVVQDIAIVGLIAEDIKQDIQIKANEDKTNLEIIRSVVTDAALGGAIINEAQIRRLKDEKLADAIDNETQARQSVDAKLFAENVVQDIAIVGLAAENFKQNKQIKNNADKISAEINDRKDADKALAKGISNEANARFWGDIALNTKIDSETIRAKRAESNLQHEINAEEHNRKIADALLGTAIVKEKADRQFADAIINSKFYSGRENVNFNKVTTNSIKLGQNTVNAIDTGKKAVTKYTADGKTLATTATVIKSAENGIYSNKVAKNETNIDSKTINGAIADLDTTIGNTTISSENEKINNSLSNSVSEAIETTGNLIGSMDFSKTRYVSDNDNITSAINKLDANLSAVDTNVQRLEHHVDHVENHLRGGIAATAALTALVPNARDCGNTQISVGSGNYANKVGFAAGFFHYFNDRVLVNGGASFATSNDWAFRAGITFGL